MLGVKALLNKSINLQKEVRVADRTIAFINSQISVGYGSINFSIQVTDKDYITSNPSLLKDEYDAFLNEIRNEAISFGWEALKETEVI